MILGGEKQFPYWNGLVVVIAFKIAGSRASRQPHVIYPLHRTADYLAEMTLDLMLEIWG
jgi:hypothetical protein